MRQLPRRRAFMVGLLALGLALAGCSSPGTTGTSQGGPTDAATTKSQAAPKEFVSEKYGFKLSLPGDWYATDAQLDWDGKKLQGLSSSTFADFEEPGSDSAFTVGATPAAEGMQLDAWRAALALAVPAGCVDPAGAKKTTWGGEPALTWATNCGDVQPIKFATVHNGRGYVAIFELNTGKESADQQTLESILKSFQFTS
jgi:hypothetical protein